ncbi:hypothetical protein [Nitrospira sp. Nam74]
MIWSTKTGYAFHVVTLALSVLFITPLAHAIDDDVKVPFLFTEDATLPQTDLRGSLPHSDAIQSDKYLNAPMTRLEYMLTKIETALIDEYTKSYVLRQLKESFEPTPDGPTVAPYARYDAQRGRIFIGYTIDNLGKPKSPLKAACENILMIMKVVAPQEPLGFLYHNTVLGVLAQKSYEHYTPSLDVLAKSVIHGARLQSATADKTIVHSLACQRNEVDAPIVYYRFSFNLND